MVLKRSWIGSSCRKLLYGAYTSRSCTGADTSDGCYAGRIALFSALWALCVWAYDVVMAPLQKWGETTHSPLRNQAPLEFRTECRQEAPRPTHSHADLDALQHCCHSRGGIPALVPGRFHSPRVRPSAYRGLVRGGVTGVSSSVFFVFAAHVRILGGRRACPKRGPPNPPP